MTSSTWTERISGQVRIGACAAAFLVILANSTRTAEAEETAQWLQWRGPSRNGLLRAEPWPALIDGNHLVQQWRVSLGPSYSTPIVAGDRVFVTETRDQRREVVTALDRKSGAKLWEVSWEGSIKVPFFAAANGSWIRATPACDGQRLYVAGMSDVLVCLDVEQGRELWRADFTRLYDTPVPAFGFVASPLIDDQHLYVQAGGGVVKLDKLTGKPLWRSLADGGDRYGSAFSSPVIATLAGRRQLVVQTRKRLAGLDLAGGQALWSVEIPATRGMNILTPTCIGDAVFTSSYGGGSRLVRVSRDGQGQWRVETAWENPAQGYMSSPVVVDGKIYLHLRNRRATCLDAASGQRLWTSGQTFGQYWSLVANGRQILALDQRGELLLLRASDKQLEVIGTRRVSDDSTWAHLVVVGDEVWIRELNALAAYRWN